MANTRKILLISNRVMHYRVSVYNYFFHRFKECGWEFIVRSTGLQKENPHPVRFDHKEIRFTFGRYKDEIEKIKPDVVILFLGLKDLMLGLWPLAHWLKFKKIPLILWTIGFNPDHSKSKWRQILFNYIHGISDGIILYSICQRTYINPKYRHKVFIANNTLNFEDFPAIAESRETIKKGLGIQFEKVVLTVGRMDVVNHRKKIHRLIEMFNGIKDEGVGLVIVGPGMGGEMLNTINKKNTLYLGEIYDSAEIGRVFKMADIFSIPGSVGLSINQAFYWGLPVVTEEGSYSPEIHYLENGRNGYIARDIEDLREKILLLSKNDALRNELSRNAKKDIRQKGSIENMLLAFKRCINYCLVRK